MHKIHKNAIRMHVSISTGLQFTVSVQAGIRTYGFLAHMYVYGSKAKNPGVRIRTKYRNLCPCVRLRV